MTGERRRRCSASVSGSPRTLATIVFQVGGHAWARVRRFVGPQIDTPAVQWWRRRERQDSAANPP
ncbi:hypothetical protein BJF79_01975 [Actinomadura sp. CNU-125]|nr:hypothetical protein BJF79_01975 [Actinomadura sp. CNU-125]